MDPNLVDAKCTLEDLSYFLRDISMFKKFACLNDNISIFLRQKVPFQSCDSRHCKYVFLVDLVELTDASRLR